VKAPLGHDGQGAVCGLDEKVPQNKQPSRHEGALGFSLPLVYGCKHQDHGRGGGKHHGHHHGRPHNE